MSADRILVNGRIVTMDPAGSTVEAVALSGERIVATGTAADLEPLCDPETETVDLGGRVVLPGFIDTHVHIDCTATHTKLAGSCHIPPVEFVTVNEAAGTRQEIHRLGCRRGPKDAQGAMDHRPGPVHPGRRRQLAEPAATRCGGPRPPGDDPLQRPHPDPQQPGSCGFRDYRGRDPRKP